MTLPPSLGLSCGAGKHSRLGLPLICRYSHFSNGGMRVVRGLVMAEYGKHHGNRRQQCGEKRCAARCKRWDTPK